MKSASETKKTLTPIEIRQYIFNRRTRLAALTSCQYHEALQLFESDLKTSPKAIDLLQGKAEALRGLSQFQNALKVYEEALTINSKIANLHCGKAQILYELSRFQDALLSYEKSLAIDNTISNISAMLGYAKIQCQLSKEFNLDYFDRLMEFIKQHEAVVKTITQEKLKSSENTNIQRLVAEFLYSVYKYAPKDLTAEFVNRGYSQVLKSFENALKINPKDAAAHRGKGYVLLELNCPGLALRSFDTALNLNPEDAAAHKGAGDALFKLKCDGLNSYETALELNSAFSDAYCAKGKILSIYLDYHNPTDALNNFEMALKLNSKNIEAIKGKGKTLLILKRYQEAIECFDVAIKSNSDVEAYIDKGRTLYEIAKQTLKSHFLQDLINHFRGIGSKESLLQKSLECYEMALAIDESSDVFYSKYLILRELGHHEEADKALSKVEDSYYPYSVNTTPPDWWQQSSARRMLLRKAMKGDTLAQCELGFAYFYGNNGFPKSQSEADKWLQKAADKGNQIAIEYLKAQTEFHKKDVEYQKKQTELNKTIAQLNEKSTLLKEKLAKAEELEETRQKLKVMQQQVDKLNKAQERLGGVDEELMKVQQELIPPNNGPILEKRLQHIKTEMNSLRVEQESISETRILMQLSEKPKPTAKNLEDIIGPRKYVKPSAPPLPMPEPSAPPLNQMEPPNVDKKQLANKPETSEFTNLNQEFLCPIIFVPMTDPVFTKAGFSYSREGIQNWIKERIEKNKIPIDPLSKSELITAEELSHLKIEENLEKWFKEHLTPNHHLKSQVYEAIEQLKKLPESTSNPTMKY